MLHSYGTKESTHLESSCYQTKSHKNQRQQRILNRDFLFKKKIGKLLSYSKVKSSLKS